MSLYKGNLTECKIYSEDVVVLCASGTAVIVDLSYMLDLESIGTFGPPFIPFNANTLGTYGIGSQPTTGGRKAQDPVLFERSISEGNEVMLYCLYILILSIWK